MNEIKTYLPLAGRLIPLSEAEERGFGSRPSLYRRVESGLFKATKIDGSLLLIGDSLIEAMEKGMIGEKPNQAA